MSSVKYATEDTIRSLILLIKTELSNYVTKEELSLEPSSSISFEKITTLPEHGEPNVIYLLLNAEAGDNIYDEYFWNVEDSRFELIGPVDMGVIDNPIPDSEIDNMF